jgi:hypothetical protein
MAASLTHEEFSKHVNTIFQVQLDESTNVPLELRKVSEHLLSPNQERFSIIFYGSQEQLLGQGARRFQHDQMGEFDLFIVPVGRDDKWIHYEAVFNRMHKTVPNSGKNVDYTA